MRAIFEKINTFFKSKVIKQILAFIAVLCALVLLSVLILNVAIIEKTQAKIYSIEDIELLHDTYDCILVLGAGVRADGSPTPMLNDRLITATQAYEGGKSTTVFVTGDSEYEGYSETDTMKRVLIENGVPDENIICDGYGLSTYESMWRAKNVYGYKRVLIVTQRYHLHRALYIAEKMGLDAEGLDAALQGYAKQPIYSTREFFARVKDFYFTLVYPKAEYAEKWN